MHRKCRDILPLITFIAFWAGGKVWCSAGCLTGRACMQLAESLPVATGMFVVCGMAYKSGDINRLVYGVDTQGMTCGSRSVYLGTTFDLTSRKNLYYLNPLDLLSVDGIAFAKTVCVDSCPGAATCPLGVFPCTDSAAFRCAAVQPCSKAGTGHNMLTCEI